MSDICELRAQLTALLENLSIGWLDQQRVEARFAVADVAEALRSTSDQEAAAAAPLTAQAADELDEIVVRLVAAAELVNSYANSV